MGPRTLCNACGLVYAKMIKKRFREKINMMKGQNGKHIPPQATGDDSLKGESKDDDGYSQDLWSELVEMASISSYQKVDDTVQEGQTCLGCNATSTPEWRRGPMGPRTLCNACGLVYAKLQPKLSLLHSLWHIPWPCYSTAFIDTKLLLDSVSPTGRNFFLSPQPTNVFKPEVNLEYALAKLVPFTEHKNIIRRGGVASTIKDCSFHAAGQKAILSPESALVSVTPSKLQSRGIDALPYLLLSDPKNSNSTFDQEKLLEPLQFLPPTKTRKSDSTIRLTPVETLHLLCHTRWGRDYLRQHGVTRSCVQHIWQRRSTRSLNILRGLCSLSMATNLRSPRQRSWMS
ncbi:uncharacterized protein LACBIDRAFT_302899 [Laccaria bicolor S238N-H82]|uniref:Predicted protein n=1 Tax=Laccaria bicolor (strain S238N-H82 / ATCC MYA-4686) TaxID=486041 RepID=B0DIK4_LACBS|nr:uncharacterized protein LACBIDRAFT_302899 [Laccaria bicolor S238N-H82]EDR05583.1 predicted protein [Laccaria bicolor S238N-H82]|eukprot:XP_001883687.1 predicted protein [Laccaria bicolor S238N-H82]